MYNVIVEPRKFTEGDVVPSRVEVLKVVDAVIASVGDSNKWPKLINENYPPLKEFLRERWVVVQSIKEGDQWFIFEVKYCNNVVAFNRTNMKEFPPKNIVLVC